MAFWDDIIRNFSGDDGGKKRSAPQKSRSPQKAPRGFNGDSPREQKRTWDTDTNETGTDRGAGGRAADEVMRGLGRLQKPSGRSVGGRGAGNFPSGQERSNKGPLADFARTMDNVTNERSEGGQLLGPLGVARYGMDALQGRADDAANYFRSANGRPEYTPQPEENPNAKLAPKSVGGHNVRDFSSSQRSPLKKVGVARVRKPGDTRQPPANPPGFREYVEKMREDTGRAPRPTSGSDLDSVLTNGTDLLSRLRGQG